MRNAADTEFAEFIDHIGEDCSSACVNLDPFLACTSDFVQLQEDLYPNHVLTDPDACVQRAFLTLLNVDVDSFNAHVLERLPGIPCMYPSIPCFQFFKQVLIRSQFVSTYLSYSS